jgi:selenide, water dikinase
VLRGLEGHGDERLLVGPKTMDDAGVVLLGEGEGLPAGSRLALVLTIDFFPPVVDDPYLYGAIAAANALSDVYAMGGKPVAAVALASLPKDLPQEWIAEIHRGGFEKLREARAAIAGGHTVEGQIQFGFSVTGVVDPARMTANSNAKSGDVAYLTKPLGMGTMTTAAKFDRIDWEAMLPAARQMATLNARAADAMLAANAHACTDITGFGLVGHARNIAAASGLSLRIEASRVPLFPGALDLSRKGSNSGGAKRGRAALAEEVSIAPGLEEPLVNLLFDAETSGGLLIVVSPADAATLERELAQRSLPVHRIGQFGPTRGVTIEIV